MIAYYNEFDPSAAAWLRELINAGLIAPGIVDERSIEDVRPDDLTGFNQCHFFAGIAVWSLALRNAGWPDSRPIWTGSCPCQPFSAAGQGAGFADERHLWPAFYHLIGQCRPAAVLGEQVASSHIDPWIDLVHADMEALGYAFGGVPFPSAGVGAPHIRDRLYWVAYADNPRLQGRTLLPERDYKRPAGQGGMVSGLADDILQQRPERIVGPSVEHDPRGWQQGAAAPAGLCADSWLAYADGGNAGPERQQRSGEQRQQPQDGGRGVVALGGGNDSIRQLDDRGRPGPTNGFWCDADWLGCRDGKWRPVEPGTFPLVNGAAARVGRLRGYGNAINAEAARVFIQAVMSVLD